jgi:patatin-like phospholipase/acyl hydrolase
LKERKKTRNTYRHGLSQGFYSFTKHHDKEAVEEERVYSAYTSTFLFITKGSQDRNYHKVGTWRQEWMQKPWRNAAYWFASPGLLSLLSYRTQDYQLRDGTAHNGLGPPPLILITN